MLKKVKINFVDFWKDFDKHNNFIYNSLKLNYEVEISEYPDYIFFSNFGYDFLNYSDAIRIFYSGESIIPDFNLCDYAIGFHFLQFEDRYMRLPLFVLYDQELIKAEKKHQDNDKILSYKTDFCNFIYSNSKGDRKRKLFFEELSKYKFVSSGGSFLNNMGGKRVENKYLFQQKFKFTIAFENSHENGYTTEKILQAFSAKTIPIYWGNPKVEEDFNGKSFINCHSFKNFSQVIDLIKQIDSDDELFLRYINAPIYADQKSTQEYNMELNNFLDSILTAEKKQSFRRNATFWGKTYEEKINTAFNDANIKGIKKSWFKRF
jgi:hypothetical protein